ncbi:hypothetical protein CPB86DRAFT_791290 [Serendipita vermifera]|nr:hypothetical protein CPB86DRAFT_791290 [Serendipita vermifera]
MADIATDDFLMSMKSKYPTERTSLTASSDVLNNPWWIPVAVAFSAGNRPDAVPILFKFALSDLIRAQKKFGVKGNKAQTERLVLARKFRDVLFKGGMTGGYSKAINALNALHEVMPGELRDTKTVRDIRIPLAEHEVHGRQFFSLLYGDDANRVQGLLDSILPEIGWFSNTIAYGYVYGFTEVTNPLETLYTLVGSLIAVDTPLQISWHLNNARRYGASLEQVRAVRHIAIEASKLAGVVRRNQVPEVNEVDTRWPLKAGSPPDESIHGRQRARL